MYRVLIRLLGDGSGRVRGRVVGVYGLLIAINALTWTAAVVAVNDVRPTAGECAPGASLSLAASAMPGRLLGALGTVIAGDARASAASATNLYAEAGAGELSPAVAGALPRVYVPNHTSGDVTVIDPTTLTVIDRFKVGSHPQHVVPAWDLQTLWVANDAEGRIPGSVTPIDPRTGKPGQDIAVDDPYNIYFTPDGRSAIVVAERRRRLDFRDPHTMALQYSIPTPDCAGVNHADFSPDGRYAIFTCEFDGSLVKINLENRSVVGYLPLLKGAMPQDIRISPDGKLFYVADMMADGVFLIDGDAFEQVGFVATGVGTHGLYPSRDGKQLYVANRGVHDVHGVRHGRGSVTVLDFATQAIQAVWPVPGGGSPDMGNVTVDGRQLWLSGRFDDVVYVFDTMSGDVKTIPVGREPHGLTVWPQPGEHSLGHTGNMR
jgi:YVTN family beta-propeller protein